ncbi:hypothetical protein PHLGIDRAFT_24881 [Phlebiopsis gigantea 11061_1 CR5-6]|uniref:Choline/carnitine acyltransferase domain-containing protein n=1 Tax=Phlebiopsis gigantea (strain 11061_1 CR5-6) TaxID=745531 RepID=A0A0C3S5X7_PHLG1|nr:hypothetical protein PHLGIDRAFT_24881 [Phlebiopsis gigantea 11061_1 CR5-6]
MVERKHLSASFVSTIVPTTPRLPRLPVPDLHQTLQRYLASLEPFVLEGYGRDSAQLQTMFATRKQWADDFERGVGSVLQERLRALDRASPNNWLDDNIWLKKAYHEWRAPLVVNSNWWLSFKNDQTVPQEVLLGHGGDVAKTGCTAWQVRRAAWLIHRLLEFKQKLQKQLVYPESTKTGIWFRHSASKIFNVCRIPQATCDTASSPPPPSLQSGRTVLLFVHDWMYAVEVLNEDLTPISAGELERALLQVVFDVSRRLDAEERAVPISVLTADERDRWTENYQHLLSLSPYNREIATIVHHSIIGLSLDHYTYALSSPPQQNPLPTPDTQEEMDAHLHNIRSSHPAHPGRNRWFDKPLTLIVEANSRAGAMGEHSPVDALVPSIVCDYAVVHDIEPDEFSAPLGLSEHEISAVPRRWRRLDWDVDERIRRECLEAEERVRNIVKDSDNSVLWFDAFGTDWIKRASLSPDSFIQMALQLAWYRTRHCFTATYETTLTRLFQNGRTETVRSLTADTRAWVLAMQDPSTSPQTRFALLQTAIKTHANLTGAAMRGRGIDRHFLGLRCMMQPGERHELFEDALFTQSQTWKLSTSGLSAGDQWRGTGFGSPEHDGYGINCELLYLYTAGFEVIKFGIESKYSCPDTSTRIFKESISSALLDMQTLCSQASHAHL